MKVLNIIYKSAQVDLCMGILTVLTIYNEAQDILYVIYPTKPVVPFAVLPLCARCLLQMSHVYLMCDLTWCFVNSLVY